MLQQKKFIHIIKKILKTRVKQHKLNVLENYIEKLNQN